MKTVVVVYNKKMRLLRIINKPALEKMLKYIMSYKGIANALLMKMEKVLKG